MTLNMCYKTDKNIKFPHQIRFFKLKMHQIRFRPGLIPLGELTTLPQTP